MTDKTFLRSRGKKHVGEVGKVPSISLPLRGPAANSRAPSYRVSPPDYASTSYISLNFTAWWGLCVHVSIIATHNQIASRASVFVCTVWLSWVCHIQWICWTAHSHYPLRRGALSCVNVFVFQFLSAMSMSHVLALSSGRGGRHWCRDLSWSHQTWEVGRWTNTTLSTYAAVREP